MKQIILLLLLSLMPLLKAEEQIIACDNSIEMFDWAFEFIEHAEQTIEFAPCYFGGELFHKMMALFEKQMQQHPKLQIHLLFEGTYLEPEDKKLLAYFERRYPRQFHFLTVARVIDAGRDLMGINNHIKMLVVDETYYTFGGSNYDYVISSEGTRPEQRRRKEGIFVADMLPNGGRDQDIAGKGEMARQLRESFYKVYALWESYNKGKRFTSKNPEDFANNKHYKALKSSDRPQIPAFDEQAVVIPSSNVKLFMGGPWKRPNAITEEYKRLINSAQCEIFIGNLYFAPVDELMHAFQHASKRGVKTTVVTNGINDQAPDYTEKFAYANRIHYLPILKGRTYNIFEKFKSKRDRNYDAHFYEYYVKDIVYHKKVMIIDERTFVIGCYNLDVHSDAADYELLMVIDSPELVREAKKVAQRDIDHSIKLSNERIQEWYFDPVVFYKATLQKKAHLLV